MRNSQNDVINTPRYSPVTSCTSLRGVPPFILDQLQSELLLPVGHVGSKFMYFQKPRQVFQLTKLVRQHDRFFRIIYQPLIVHMFVWGNPPAWPESRALQRAWRVFCHFPRVPHYIYFFPFLQKSMSVQALHAKMLVPVQTKWMPSNVHVHQATQELFAKLVSCSPPVSWLLCSSPYGIFQ